MGDKKIKSKELNLDDYIHVVAKAIMEDIPNSLLEYTDTDLEEIKKMIDCDNNDSDDLHYFYPNEMCVTDYWNEDISVKIAIEELSGFVFDQLSASAKVM